MRHTHSASLDCGFELASTKRQDTGTAQRTEQHRADDATTGFGDLCHVEANRELRGRAGLTQQLSAIDPSIPHRGFFRN